MDGLKLSGTKQWYDVMDESGCYIDAKANPNYVPKTGDVVFLDYEHDGVIDHVAMIVVDGDGIKVLHGNWSKRVRLTTLDSDTGVVGTIRQAIVGYGDVSKYAANH